MSSETLNNPINQEELMKNVGKHLNLLKEKSKIDPKIVLGIILIGILLTVLGWFDKYITCIIGITLPTYWSIKAIESPEENDDKQWLTYWSVYAVFSFLDLFAKFILKIIPFYYVVKLIFLVWCFMPNTQGALFIYNKVLRNFFIKNEEILNKYVNKIMKKTHEVSDKAKEEINKGKDKLIDNAINNLKKNE
jgi:receptor expression-enhancing protein 5/6